MVYQHHPTHTGNFIRNRKDSRSRYKRVVDTHRYAKGNDDNSTINNNIKKKIPNMNNVIERIYQRTTEYSHPAQATTTANALDLLSSGIYTEEERFIFELLQNAVDSFDIHKQTVLEIRIVLTDNLLVFMHNGSPFSERDLEGLCDIGNGNKIMDAKKIGYKGIGFKSVFMHSHRVTVWTAGTCFKFDKEACEAFAKSKGSGYEDVKMPWQIIPILTKTPSGINTEGFNVITYIEISNKKSLKRKVEKLLSDTRFLLFLKVDDLRVSFWEEGEEILNLSKKQTADELTLSVNGNPQSSWLIYSTEVKLTSEVKDALVHDSKTPTKLKDSDSVEISFAIALDKDKNIIPLSDAVMYTYLPTSFSFGLNFIVNANFITDAGRQQIVKDCAWNEFIFAQIPGSYLNWIRESVAKTYSDWYTVLPPYSKSEDELSEAYSAALKDALNTIPFIKAVNGDMVLLQEALTDNIGLNSAIPPKIFNSFVHANILKNTNAFSLVSSEIGQALQKMYDVANITTEHVYIILEKANEYLKNLTDEEMLTFLMWLRGLSQDLNNDFKRSVSYASIFPDKNTNLIAPVESFFPSEYSDKNPDISADAKIIRKSLADKFSDEMIDWLKELGVQEMSNLSVIEKVLCKKDYITKENCIRVIQFIFDNEQKEHVLDKLTSFKIRMLKILTKKGNLETADNTFMDSSYGIRTNGDSSILEEYFVSTEYIRKKDDAVKWQLFFRKIGVNTEICVKIRRFGSTSMLYKSFSSLVDYCTKNETNYSYPIHTCGYFVHIYIQAQLPPILNFSSDGFSKCKFVWSNAMEHPVNLDGDEDYIAGHTGWNHYAYGYFKDNRDGHKYLGELVLPYLLKTRNLLPGTDKQLHRSVELLAPTEENYQLYGHYLPILDIETQIDNSWFNILDFKTKLSLSDYLSVLSQISLDKENMTINKNRINNIYERIADSFDFSENSSDFTLVQNWGQSHKILSKEGRFESPHSLYLLSSKLSGVELDNQVFHAKYLENDRFASFMIALGVNMVVDYRESIGNGEYKPDINHIFDRKEDFLTSIAVGDHFTKDTWEEAKSKMHNTIMKMKFYQADNISIYYGNQGFPKKVYSKANEFYFVGKFGLANQELLHDDIMAALGLPKKVSTIFLAILQMDDFLELKEYIKQKGYDTSFIEEHNDLIRDKNQPAATMSGENAAYGGLTKEEMGNALEEAKEAVLDKLSKDGFDISNKEWDGWTCIDGVRKDGREYPLVIRSNKSQRNTCLSPKDWNQLMKPNAMFAVVTNTGIGTICLREILKSKEFISIKFRSENIDNPKHISELATVFAYFKGIQLDFESYIHPVINQWERFMAPEQATGELPIAVSPSALPE